MKKTCSRCSVEKEIENFGRRKNSKDGYHGVCLECRNNDTKKWRKSKIYTDGELSIRREAGRINYINNREIILVRCKKYRDNNKESSKEYKKMYYSKNREKLIKYSTDFHINRMKNDTLYKFAVNIRCLIKNSIKNKGYKKNTKTEEILGIDILGFFKYIESMFEPWMTWENRGLYNGELNYGWDIDHIIPISSATNEDDVLRLNHYTNLKPLCSYTNRNIKKDKLDFK